METQKVEVTDVKDILVAHLNKFKKSMVDNALDLRRHAIIQEADPSYEKPMQNGQYVKVAELIERYRNEYKNAKSYVEIIAEILSKNDEAEMFAFIEGLTQPQAVKSPVDMTKEGGDEEKEEEGAKE